MKGCAKRRRGITTRTARTRGLPLAPGPSVVCAVFAVFIGVMMAGCGGRSSSPPSASSASSASNAIAGAGGKKSDLTGKWIGYCRDDEGREVEFLPDGKSMIADGIVATYGFLSNGVMSVTAGGQTAAVKYTVTSERLALTDTSDGATATTCTLTKLHGAPRPEQAVLGRWRTRSECFEPLFAEGAFYSDGTADVEYEQPSTYSYDKEGLTYSVQAAQMTLAGKNYQVSVAGTTMTVTSGSATCRLNRIE